MFYQIIAWGAVISMVLGGIDYLLGGRFGLGAEFEKGILSAGRLLMCMTGFLVLVPVIAQVLSPLVVPAFRAVKLDPSMLAGLLFANDSGGAALAMEMADDPDMGMFSGLIVGAMMGTTVMFFIPLTILNTSPDQREPAIYGMLAGIITIPVGCLAGGLAAGFSGGAVVYNTIPVLIIAVFLALMLLFCRNGIVKALSLFGNGILVLSTAGLVISSAQRLTGVCILPGMGPLDEVFSIVGNICIFLAGIFPMLHILQKMFSDPLHRAGDRIGINSASVAGFLLALANGIPVCELLKDMDDKGRMVNVAFLVSVSCVFGDHLAYTRQVAPAMCSAVMLGKLAGGISAAVLAMLLAPRLLNHSTSK